MRGNRGKKMLTYRKIEPGDDSQIAKIIRTNLEKLHLDIQGTAYFDPELEHLSTYYSCNPQKRVYLIALNEAKQVLGGVGVAEFNGFANCAELQKLYLDDSVKGMGYGKKLMQLAQEWAKKAGYQKMYLETHTNLAVAIKLYEKMGFQQLERPDIAVHGTMNRFYIKAL